MGILLGIIPLSKEYIKKSGRDVEENIESVNLFENYCK